MPVQQRVLVVGVIAVIVGGLILAGCSPHVALTVASGIVLVASQVWLADGREARGRRPPSDDSGDPSDHAG